MPGSRRAPGEGNHNPLQYSCLENSMERILLGYFPWGSKELDTTENNMINSQQPKKKKKLEQKEQPAIEREIVRKASSKNTKIWDN